MYRKCTRALTCESLCQAHQKMREGQRLLELREDFQRWEDVVEVGLPSFSDAEVLYRDAGELFDDLDHHDNKLQATDRMTESFERKTHAQVRKGLGFR